MNALNPDVSSWASTTKTNMILADIFDMLAQINANLVAIGSRKPARSVKPYPRPWAKEPDSVQKIGKGALPKNELRKWIERKRAEFNGRNRSSTGDDNRHSSA